MKEETTPKSQPEKKSNKKMWTWIIGAVAVLAVIGALTKDDPRTEQATSQVVTEQVGEVEEDTDRSSPSEDSQGDSDEDQDASTSSESGLGLSTEMVRSVFSRHGMSTTLGAPVNGLDNWSGQSQHVVGQIIADGESVQSLQLVILFNASDPSSLKADVAGNILSDLDPKAPSAAQKLLTGNSFNSDWTDAVVVTRGVLRAVYSRGDGTFSSLVFVLEA